MKKQEIKNFFWGIIAPFIMVFIFKSWWGYLLTAGIAILIQVAIGKKEAAAMHSSPCCLTINILAFYSSARNDTLPSHTSDVMRRRRFMYWMSSFIYYSRLPTCLHPA